MANLVNGIKKLDSGLAALQRWFLLLLMALLSAAMFAEVVTRYLFGTSLFGLEQFVGFAAVWLYMIGSSYGSYERSHIRAEFIGVFVKSKRKMDIIRVFSGAVSTGMSFIFAKWSYDFCLESIKMHETTPTQSVPMVYFQSSLFVGAVLMTAYFLWETIDYLRQVFRP